MDDVRIRPARPGEADALSALVRRSKAYWGYDEAFMEACAAELSFGPERLVAGRAVVAETAGGRVAGVASLDGDPPRGELGMLFVDPPFIGRGAGRLLYGHVLDAARAAGFTALRIDADPHAEGFYRAMGAVRIGVTPSGSVPGRELPLLEARLA